jgi:hypothetical protein
VTGTCVTLSHGLVVESVGAVGDDYPAGERAAQVLGGLRLARAGRALRAAAAEQVQCRRQRDVASAVVIFHLFGHGRKMTLRYYESNRYYYLFNSLFLCKKIK